MCGFVCFFLINLLEGAGLNLCMQKCYQVAETIITVKLGCVFCFSFFGIMLYWGTSELCTL